MATIEESGLFMPKDGVMSEADRIIAHLHDVPIGTIIAYEDLDRVLGRDFRTDRAPWYTATRRFVRENPGKGMFINVRGIGFQKVDSWSEVQDASKDRQKRAARQIHRSRTEVTAADRTKMTASEQQAQTDVQTRLGRLESALRSQKKEISLVKKQVKSKAEKSDVDELRRQIEELTKKVDGA